MISPGRGEEIENNINNSHNNIINDDEKGKISVFKRKIIKTVKEKFSEDRGKKEYENRIDEMQSQMDQMVVNSIEKDRYIKSLKNDIKKYKKEKQIIEQINGKLNSENENLKTENQFLINSKIEINNKIDRFYQSILLAENKIKLADKNVEILIDSIEKLTNENEELKEVIENYENEFIAEKSIKNVALSQSLEMKDQEQYISNLTSQYEQSILIYKSKLDQLTKENKNLNLSVDKLVDETIKLRNNIEKLDKRRLTEKEIIEREIKEKNLLLNEFERKKKDFEFVYKEIYYRVPLIISNEKTSSDFIDYKYISDSLIHSNRASLYAKFLEAIEISTKVYFLLFIYLFIYLFLFLFLFIFIFLTYFFK